VDDTSPPPSPGYTWAAHAEPDFLALQVPPAPVVSAGGVYDALRALLGQRGFEVVTADDELGLRAANGCLLTQTSPTSFDLLVTVGPRAGATRMALTGLDPAWVERVVATRHVPVLLVESAVEDGATDRDRVRRDVAAGAVLGALVPASAPEDL
jgi:hypothetical protein